MKPAKNSPSPDSARLLASYGRRRGRKLRARPQQLMDELLPRIAVAWPPEGAVEPRALLPDCAEHWLEIGFGGGEHLAAQAAANPRAGLIGCEPYVNGMASLLAKIEGAKLGNIRIHSGDARELIARLPDAALARVFILYPDPWPKARHHKRRLISATFLAALARAMQPGARLRLATDDADYAQWMREHLAACPYFRLVSDSPAPPSDWVPTRYEGKAKAAGRVPCYLDFHRI